MPILTVEDRLDTLFAGRYQLEAVLGTGGTGIVYLARHSWTGRTVAVKLLKPHLASDVSLVRRFLQEARSASEVAHPNVVQVLDLGAEDDGTVFLVMERLVGRSLQERVADGVLDLEETLRVLVPIMDTLVHAHRAGIVHRDLKPANIFLHEGVGAHPTPKLLDFGMAKILDPEWGRATQTGTIVGTPYYMSPEQAEGANDQGVQCDVWALGVVFHRCLAGRLPFTGDSAAQLLLSLVRDQAPRLVDVCDVPAEIGSVIDRALIADRDERWPDIVTFLEALREACAEISTPFPRLPSEDPMPERPTFEPGPRRAPRRRWWTAALAGAIVVAAAAWWTLDRDVEDPMPQAPIAAPTVVDPPTPEQIPEPTTTEPEVTAEPPPVHAPTPATTTGRRGGLPDIAREWE